MFKVNGIGKVDIISIKHTRSGFLLIEVVVSLLLLVIISTSLATWYNYTINLNYCNYCRVYALNLAVSAIEKAKNSTMKKLSNYIKYNKSQEFKVRLEKFIESNLSGFYILVVNVTWEVNKETKSLILSTGING